MVVISDFLRENFLKKMSLDGKRIEFLDLAKGICIIIVVFLHADFSSVLLTPLYLPLFFTLSGYFFSDYDGFLNFLIKKVNQLIVPLIFFFTLGLVIRICTNPEINLFDLIKQPFIEPLIQNAPIWFLICLFWVNLFYYFLHTKVNYGIVRMIICLCLGFVGMILDIYSIYLPLFLGPAFSATPFFFVGVMLRKTPILYKTKHEKTIFISAIVILVAVITYCLMIHTPGIIFVENKHMGGYFEILIVSILMVICFLMLCKTVKWLPIISYFGRYSIIVLGVHNLFLGYAYLPIHWATGHVFSQLELLALTLLLTWISVPFFKKFFKKYCGQDSLIVLRGRKK